MQIALTMIAWELHIYFIRIFCLQLISQVFAFLSSLIDITAPDSAGKTESVEQVDALQKVVRVGASEKVEHIEAGSASWEFQAFDKFIPDFQNQLKIYLNLPLEHQYSKNQIN